MKKLFWLLFIPIWGCTNTQPAKPAFKTEILDTIGDYKMQQYIPKDLIKEDNCKLGRKDETIWPLYSIENGVDSFELRLHIQSSMTDVGNMYIIRYSNSSGWISSHVLYSYDYKHSLWSNLQIERDTPKCGWKQFMDTLNNSGIYALPSQKQIKGFQDMIGDGFEYVFEIATKNSYKRIGYHDPEPYSDSSNKTFWRILLFWDRNMELTECPKNRKNGGEMIRLLLSKKAVVGLIERKSTQTQ